MEARHDGGASQVVDLAEGGGRQILIEADDPTLVDADGVSGGSLGILPFVKRTSKTGVIWEDM